MLKFSVMAAAAALLLAAPVGAQTSKTFNTTGATGTSGALSFTAANDPTLQLRVTAWQSNQATDGVNAGYLAAYDAGLGVIGNGDQNGAGARHQIDNVGGYTDFLLLQFNRAVTLTSATLNLYQISGLTAVDSDLAFFNAGAVLQPAAWNAAIDLTSYRTVPSLWTDVAGGSTGGSRQLAATGASNYWLLGASFLPTGDRDDGFKLSQLAVTEQVAAAVPEPGTWAMMLVGFGAIGGSLRRSLRRPKGAGAALGLA